MQASLDNSNPPIYSARAIFTFSVLFSTVVGGVMLSQNLKDVGQPKAARKALWGGIGYITLILVATAFLPERSGGNSLGLVFGLFGGMALNRYFKKTVQNQDEFPAKSIVKPLLICLLIFIPLLLLMFYSLFNQ